jgi:toxin CcdB
VRQFDVFENPSAASRQIAPYLVVLSSHLLDVLDVVIVAPLLRDRTKPMAGLEISIEFEGERLILAITDLASLEPSALKRRAGSLRDQEDAIRRALDRLFTGF